MRPLAVSISLGLAVSFAAGIDLARSGELPSCSTLPSTDTDIFFVRDTTSLYYEDDTFATEIGEGMQQMAEWYAKSQNEVMVSLGAGNHRHYARCYADLVNNGTFEAAQKALASIRTAGQDFYFATTSLMMLAFLQHGKWNASVGTSYRRIYVILTEKSPNEIWEEEIKLTTFGVMNGNCPIRGQVPAWQTGDLLRSMEAGLGVFLINNGHGSDHHSSWSDYLFVEAGHTDVILQEATKSDIADRLFQMVTLLSCPSWIATTSTAKVPGASTTEYACDCCTTKPPSMWEKEAIYNCLVQISRCSFDSAYAEDALAECLKNH